MSAASGELRFNARHIEQLGTKLTDGAGGEITAARGHINAAPRKVEATSFTTFCVSLAHVYVQATEYADVDLVTKLQQLKTVEEKLAQTAKILREAEQKSTVKPS